MGYNAIYPADAIEAHRAFIARRRSLRLSEEYRTPTNDEWDACLSHFEKCKLSLGTCARAFGTSCIHEHACVRCPLLRPEPSQRDRLIEIRNNLLDRIAEAQREGWIGAVEGLEISLAGAEDKPAQHNETLKPSPTHLGCLSSARSPDAPTTPDHRTWNLAEMVRRLLRWPRGKRGLRSCPRVITDRYVNGTRLRLRRADFADGRCELKFTQKVPVLLSGAIQGLITNTYLSPAEYDVLASLPATMLSKTRFSVPPLGVDVFDGRLQGLVLGEAEFTTDEEVQAFVPPAECVAEVTDDARFAGGCLVQASRQELLGWLAEYGIRPQP
ncbi:hypothetical protein SLITK23_75470 [Streptomyces lividans]|nr:hypothetical protein SLITK23_75470 [Streptomyces lividans]